MQCPACTHTLRKVHTKQGVIVDYCDSCKGVWLDDGEIYMFSHSPKWLHEAMEKGLIDSHSSERYCPCCQNQLMIEGGFINPQLLIDACPSCKGLWFDDGELKQALELGKNKFRMSMEQDQHGLFYARQDNANVARKQEYAENTVSHKKQRLDALRAGMLPLPGLALRSTLSFVLLYGMLVFVLLLASEVGGWSQDVTVGIALVGILFQFLISPWIMDFMLRWLYKMHWVSLRDLPDHLARFVEKTCQANHMNVPSIGIIEDSNPNAFTYGHTPNNARVILTRGLFEYLEPEEVEAVAAHELGHARHWDILVMTLASMVPVILYHLYRTFNRMSRYGSNNKGKGATQTVAIVSYILYIIAEYIVLWLSRTREYWADRFAGQVTENPNALASALVKIAYGMVTPRHQKEKLSEDELRQQKERADNLDAIKALGIFDRKAALALAVNAYTGVKSDQKVDKEKIVSAMQWDMWNPWASYYELHSTHPLPAKRINALTDQAAVMQQEPYVVFNRKKPESYWDEFLVDVGVHLLPIFPLICLLYFLIHHGIANTLSIQNWWRVGGAFCLLFAVCYLIRVLFSYPHTVFPRMKISTLLSKVKVSEVRPIPVTITGTVVGRGVPGYILSEDMVLEDDTGIIFLDYRQPLGIIELLFAIFKTDNYIDDTVVVEGWYRRAPMPFIEVKTLKRSNRGNSVHRCHVYTMKLVCVFLLVAGAIACFLKAAGAI